MKKEETIQEKRRRLIQRQKNWAKGRMEERGRKSSSDSNSAGPVSLGESLLQPVNEICGSDKYLYDMGSLLNARGTRGNAYNDAIVDSISNMLKTQIRQELEKETNLQLLRQSMVNRKLGDFLSMEIETHTCDVCFQLMLPPERAPIIAYPCGHTFCAHCMSEITQRKRGVPLCPDCRDPIESQAINLPLQHVTVY